MKNLFLSAVLALSFNIVTAQNYTPAGINQAFQVLTPLIASEEIMLFLA
ncbi:hypothetical protein ODZ84_16670 [Chryseobacterium fluminis]|nr:hypothetical protein [Chryseobacterium sp. MMS21-Ot14]UZT96839.1 hypothetical protein ODZ84_16670 [Chryseobacterium sp. MMS21-Ot14]